MSRNISLKLSKTTSPQKIFSSDCITLYVNHVFFVFSGHRTVECSRHGTGGATQLTSEFVKIMSILWIKITLSLCRFKYSFSKVSEGWETVESPFCLPLCVSHTETHLWRYVYYTLYNVQSS